MIDINKIKELRKFLLMPFKNIFSYLWGFLRNYQWFIVVGLALLAFAMGVSGYLRFYTDNNKPLNSLSAVYGAVQMFVLNSSLEGNINPMLQVARFLAPALFFFTAFKALAVLLNEQFALLRLKVFYRDHTIVCGLGYNGLLFVKALREHNEKVVVIEIDENNKMIKQCRAMGAIVLTGDATEFSIFKKAKVRKAKWLIVTCGDDGVNSEITTMIREKIEHQQTLTCLTYISDMELCNLLREREIIGGSKGSFRLEFFNVCDTGAKFILESYIPGIDLQQETKPNVLLLGYSAMAESLIAQTAREILFNKGIKDNKVCRFTIVDQNAVQKRDALLEKINYINEVCEVECVNTDVNIPHIHTKALVNNLAEYSTVIIYLDNEHLAFSRALQIINASENESSKIIVCMNYSSGIPKLLQFDENDSKYNRLHSYGLLDMACTYETLVTGTHNIIAKAYHEQYYALQSKRGNQEQYAYCKPWVELTDQERESNRLKADFLQEQLRYLQMDIRMLTGPSSSIITLDEQQKKSVAASEHDRWFALKEKEGWSYGEKRDPAKKKNQFMIPFDELPDYKKQELLDEAADLPNLLAGLGFQLYKIPDASKEGGNACDLQS